MDRKTSEWPALHAVWAEKKQIIVDREKEHAQHVIDHGAPRTRPELWLAALVLMKANRIWNNLVRGGTSGALRDSVLDLSNYADFLAALLDEQANGPRAQKPVIVGEQFQEPQIVFHEPRVGATCAVPVLPHPYDANHCFTCGEPFKPGDVRQIMDVYHTATGPWYCAAHLPVEHK